MAQFLEGIGNAMDDMLILCCMSVSSIVYQEFATILHGHYAVAFVMYSLFYFDQSKGEELALGLLRFCTED